METTPLWYSNELFQSTLPAGEATIHMIISHLLQIFQSTLPAGEATRADVVSAYGVGISIHASRGGSDIDGIDAGYCTRKFQSTLPAGEATVSISPQQIMAENFNPRFPRGKRPRPSEPALPIRHISIHASRGGSDGKAKLSDVFGDISIHASRGGSDCAVKLSPNYRTWRHGLREPGFHRFFYRRFPCFFLLGAWGSRL